MKANSYGIIPIFKDKNNTYVLLVKNSKGGHWGLPKGTPDKDEQPFETAKRELLEETGVKDIEVKEEPTFEESYSFDFNGQTYNKTNTYYLGFLNEMLSGKELDQIDEIKWTKINEAKNTLTHQSVIDVIERVRQFLDQNL